MPDSRITLRNRLWPLLSAGLMVLILVGCQESGGETAAASHTITGPINADTPLVRQLNLDTAMDTRLDVQLSAADHQLQYSFDSYSRSHRLPLYGLRAGRDYTARITTFAADGSSRVLEPDIHFGTAPLPEGFPSIEASADPQAMEPGYTLFNVLAEGSGNDAFGELLVIVDAEGEVVWYHRANRFLDVRQLDNGNIFAERVGAMVEMDLAGNTLRQWNPAGLNGYTGPDVTVDTPIFHHEVFPMENGNFLALSIEARDYTAYPTSLDGSSAPATSAVAGDVIVEYQPDGTIVNEWKLLDMLDSRRLGYNALGSYWDFLFPGSRDWSHGNAVIHDASDDSIIVSLRHQDALVKFSRATGELLWILGPHDNWQAPWSNFLLTPVSGQQYFWPWHPHAPEVTPHGTVLVYDNGNWRASPPDAWIEDVDNFSRAAEYLVNESTMEVELVWEYGLGAAPEYFSPFLGDADYLPQTGNVLITHGSLRSDTGKMSAQIIEVTRGESATEVFTMTVRDPSLDSGSGWRVYRSERIGSLYADGTTLVSP